MRGTMPEQAWSNREGHEEYDVSWRWDEALYNPGFSAVLRVKDEAASLPWVLPAMLRSVRRVIVVDNASTDGTAEVARSLATEAGLEEKLEVIDYPFSVSRCGPEHLGTHPESVHSLTYYYNWAFSQVDTRYALKWDGDMVLTPEGERVLRDLDWQLQSSDAAITMPRAPVYVESESVAYLDTKPGVPEPWGWRNSPNYTFEKAFDWELMLPDPGDIKMRLPDFICFELKWLDAEEFGHWSHTDFKEQINARKRREWDLFHALGEGNEAYEGVLRVESPDDTHVVEHLRRNYETLRRSLSASAGKTSVAGG